MTVLARLDNEIRSFSRDSTKFSLETPLQHRQSGQSSQSDRVTVTKTLPNTSKQRLTASDGWLTAILTAPLPFDTLDYVLFVGIDGEMSSASLADGGKLIQFGVAVRLPNGEMVSKGWLINPGEMVWSAEAAAVHQLRLEDVIEQGRPNDEVDQEAYDWLVSFGANEKRREKNVPVGFNITGFDMPFIKAQLPKTYWLLSRRTAELNGMLWLLHGLVDNNQPVNFEAWKKRSLEYAASQLEDFNPHDAEWDAKRHLLCFEYMRSVIL